MSDDIQKEPVPPSPYERTPKPANDLDIEYRYETPFPAFVSAAGWIWIALGTILLILIGLAATLMFFFAGGPNAAAAARGSHFSAVFQLFGLVALVSASYLYVGIQCIRGAVCKMFANGISSIVVGLYCCGSAVFNVARSDVLQASVVRMLFAGVEGTGGTLLVVAGLLALMGRRQYDLWRAEQALRRDREAAVRRDDARFRR